MAAAWDLRGRNLLVLEESDRLGGRMLSHPEGDYWMNLGAHLFPGEGSTMGRLVTSAGLRTIEIPGLKFAISYRGRVYAKSRVEAYPFALPLTLRERLSFALVGVTMLRSVASWRRNVAEGGSAVGPVRTPRAKSFANRRFSDLIGSPVGGVGEIFSAAARRSSTELANQSAGTGVMLFAGVWAGKRSSLAFNLEGGSAELAREITAQLGDRVRLRTAATSVSVDDDGLVTIVTRGADGAENTVRARHVIMATPATVTAAITSGLPEPVRDTLSRVTYGTFVSMGAITAETGPSSLDSIYAITTPGSSFDMMFNHANPLRTAGARKPGGSIMVYAGGDRARAYLDQSDEEITERYLRDIFELYPELRGKITKTVVQRWPFGLPFFAPGFTLAPVTAYCAGTRNAVELCGDYFGELGNLELAASSGAAAAARVSAALSARIAV